VKNIGIKFALIAITLLNLNAASSAIGI
jgi:hypothetical protein